MADPESEPGPGPARVVPVILCCRSEERLWPVARDGMPEHLWPLVAGRSLLQEALLRVGSTASEEIELAPAVVVCREESRFQTAGQVRTTASAAARIVVAAAERDGVAAAAATTLLLGEQGPGQLLWLMSPDVLVSDAEALHANLATAAAAARQGFVVALGLRQATPDASGPVIGMGPALPGCPGVLQVGTVLPATPQNLDEARARPEAWAIGSSMYVAETGTLLRVLGAHDARLAEGAAEAVANRTEDPDFIRLQAGLLAGCPPVDLAAVIAADPACAAILPTRLQGVDVGSWRALWHISAKDAEGNAALGDAFVSGSRDCYVRSEGMFTAVIGLSDAVVVVSDDAVLAMHRDSASAVPAVVERLRQHGRREAVRHRRHYHSWGQEEVLAEAEGYRVHRVVLQPGAALPAHRYRQRAGHWLVLSGTALVTLDDGQRRLEENEAVPLPAGGAQGLDNPGPGPVTLMELRMGGPGDEDDMAEAEPAPAGA